MRGLALALLLLPAAVPARAQEVAAVLSSDLSAYREALAGFEAAYGSTVPVLSAAARIRLSTGTRVVVAFGVKAALKTYPKNVVLVYCLAPTADLEPAGPPRAVYVPMVPRPRGLLARLKKAQPSLKVLAVVWQDPSRADYIARLERRADALGLSVLSLQIDGVDELPARLREARDDFDAVWLLPDPQIVTPESFSILRGFSRSTGAPFYAPTEALARRGASGVITVSFREIGRAAAKAAAAAAAGQALDDLLFADDPEVVLSP